VLSVQRNNEKKKESTRKEDWSWRVFAEALAQIQNRPETGVQSNAGFLLVSNFAVS